MQDTIRNLFPELNIKLSPQVYAVSHTDLQNNSYFQHLVENILDQYGQQYLKSKKGQSLRPYPLKDVSQFSNVKTIINKILPKVLPVKVPKGTVIYTSGASPDQGYFLIHGCVELLAKKNNWERLESFPGHTLFHAEERVDYLNSHYRINPRHFDVMEGVFYEDRMSFNFVSFQKLYSGQYFGIKQLLRGCMRTKMAVAVEDSLLVKIRRQDFDKYLKDFEQKRQQYIINCLFSGVKPEIVEDVLHRIPVAFNSTQLVSFDRDEYIFKQGQFSSGIYLLLSGQVIQSKDVRLQVPKKYLSNQNQKDIVKQVTINLHKLVKNSFVGQIEPLMSVKHRQFSCRAGLNSTLLLKIDSTAFIKTVAESALYERQLQLSAKHRYSVANEAFMKQKNLINKSFLNQFEQFDHKKKQKNISSMLNNQSNFKQNGLYELFKRQGAFYRDTFQRLEGFEDFQAKYDPKRSSIHRHKIKSSFDEMPPTTHFSASTKKQKKITEERSLTEEADLSFEATKKILMSPGKTTNQFEVFGSQLVQKLTPISEHTDGSRLKKKSKIVPKFQELKKDQTVFKRVLIKNGKYEIPRQTNKDNRMEAIVNHQFDQVVKQCMTRKSVALRKALNNNKNQVIKDEFRKALSSIPRKSASMTRIASTSFGYTCKGTEEMRRRLQKMKWFKGSTSSTGQKHSQDPRLDECIGYNKQPLSSQIKHRSSMSPSKMGQSRSPEKIVLLNHMMKPITYTSNQI